MNNCFRKKPSNHLLDLNLKNLKQLFVLKRILWQRLDWKYMAEFIQHTNHNAIFFCFHLVYSVNMWIAVCNQWLTNINYGLLKIMVKKLCVHRQIPQQILLLCSMDWKISVLISQVHINILLFLQLVPSRCITVLMTSMFYQGCIIFSRLKVAHSFWMACCHLI